MGYRVLYCIVLYTAAPEDALLVGELLLVYTCRRLYEDVAVSIFSGRRVHNPLSFLLSLTYYAGVALTIVADVAPTDTPLCEYRHNEILSSTAVVDAELGVLVK
jgi:hypothetical protein